VLRMITFEGGDGSGKTTQIDYLRAYLAGRGWKCVVTREPGGTELGRQLRRALLEGSERVTALAELLVYLADRAQHTELVIRPALGAGSIVLCDRFTDSTLAYQGYGRGFELEWLRSLNARACQGIVPDLTFLLDVPAAEGLSRTRARAGVAAGKPQDRLELEDLNFHERVRQGFLEIARAEPGRVHVLDGTLSPLEIHDRIKRIVESRLDRS
jgi:dTMP kinase